MNKIWLILPFISLPIFADISSRLNITTIDGTVSNWPYKLMCTNGSLTDNGDGTMTLATGGGGGSTTLISSGVAFGSASNTVTQDTNTLTYNDTTHSLFVSSNIYMTYGNVAQTALCIDISTFGTPSLMCNFGGTGAGGNYSIFTNMTGTLANNQDSYGFSAVDKQTTSGNGWTVGVYADAENSSFNNYGVWGNAGGPATANYAGYFQDTGGALSNYGVYGNASDNSGSHTNYGGYFQATRNGAKQNIAIGLDAEGANGSLNDAIYIAAGDVLLSGGSAGNSGNMFISQGVGNQPSWYDLFNASPTYNGQANWTSASPSTFTALTVSNTLTVSTVNIGALSPVAFSNNPLNVTDKVNTIYGANITNLSTGTAAATYWQATSALGGQTSYYVTVGIVSPNYNQAGFSIVPGSAAFLYSSDSNMEIGSAINGTKGDIIFGTNLPISANRRMTITSTGTINTLGNLNISSGVYLSGSTGSNGQVFTSGGVGTVPTWTTVSGGGGPTLVATQTWSGQNNWTTPAQSTFTYGLTVGSITVNGSSAGQVNLTEGLPAGVSGVAASHDVFWADSGSHTISANFNNSASTFSLISSSFTPVANQYLYWVSGGPNNWVVGSTAPAGGGGGSGTVGSSSVNNVAYYTAATTIGGATNLTNNGSTVTVSGITTMTQNGVSTVTATGVLFNYSSSSQTVSSMTVIGPLKVLNSPVSQYDTVIGTSPTAGIYHIAISSSGHYLTGGSTPTISSCGSTPNGSVVGNDQDGQITIGGGSVTGCVLTFAQTYGTGCIVACTISDNITTTTPDVTTSPTTMTLGFSASIGGGVVNYHCVGVTSGCL